MEYHGRQNIVSNSSQLLGYVFNTENLFSQRSPATRDVTFTTSFTARKPTEIRTNEPEHKTKRPPVLLCDIDSLHAIETWPRVGDLGESTYIYIPPAFL
jgi:hypothetical protein